MALKMPASAEKDVIISNNRGLHARAAARFVEKARQFSSRISVSKDDLRVSGRSIMGLLLLAAAKGETIRISAKGNDCEAALQALETLVGNRFREKD